MILDVYDLGCWAGPTVQRRRSGPTCETPRTSPDLAATATGELTRFDTSVQISSRVALAHTWLGSRHQESSRLIRYLGAANRDPAKFTDPERLDATRRRGAPMSFGGGIDYCFGAPLARLETQVAFPALLNRYPKLQVAEGAERRARLTLPGLHQAAHHR